MGHSVPTGALSTRDVELLKSARAKALQLPSSDGSSSPLSSAFSAAFAALLAALSAAMVVEESNSVLVLHTPFHLENVRFRFRYTIFT